MKKTFGKLFILFGVILCIFAIYGCGEVAETTVQSSETTTADEMETTSKPEETTCESKEMTSAVEETTSAVEEMISVAEETSTETTEAETESQMPETSGTEETSVETEEPVEFNGVIQDKYSDLIVELRKYLSELNAYHDMPSTSFITKINEIKNGKQPLHVSFDSTTSQYFVCGYYNFDHAREDKAYCCVEEYTWVRFEKAEYIQEYLYNQKITVAFQINMASFVTDITSSDQAVPTMEHYQIFNTEFVNGLNVNSATDIYKTFIYLNDSDKGTIYYCTDVYYHQWVTYSCVLYNNEYYINEYIFTSYSDGSSSKSSLEERYKEYYDVLMEIMIPDRGIALIKNDSVAFYGLIPIDDFANKVLK